MTPVYPAAQVAANFARCPAHFAGWLSQWISTELAGVNFTNVFNGFSLSRQISPGLAHPLLNYTCNEI
jgi:hypothetical protein